jgi:hypothetical protein
LSAVLPVSVELVPPSVRGGRGRPRLGEHEAGGGGGWVSVRFCSPLRFVVSLQSCPRFPEF